MHLDDWLKEHERGSTMLAKIERSPTNGDCVRLTPYRPGTECLCHSQLEVPRKYVASVEPTNEWCVCEHGHARIALVRFGDDANFPHDKFMSALKPAKRSAGRRVYRPGEYFERAIGPNPPPGIGGPSGARIYPGGFNEADVLFEDDFGFVLKPVTQLKCGGTAGWRQAIVCGTVFLGSSRIEIHTDTDINVGIQGLCIGCSSVHSLSSTVNTVFDTWFWGTDITVHNSFVSWSGRYSTGASVTMHH